MTIFLIGLFLGLPTGAVLNAIYAVRTIAEYRKVAAEVGVVFHTIEGKLTAVKKAL